MTLAAGSNIRILSPGQNRRLQKARHHIAGQPTSHDVRRLVATLRAVLNANVAVVLRTRDGWQLLGMSEVAPSLPAPGTPAWQVLDADAMSGAELRVWTMGQTDWTMVPLPSPDSLFLLIEGDWSLSAPALLQFAAMASAWQGSRDPRRRQAGSSVVRLTRHLNRVTGLAEVADAILLHVVRTVPSRVAALAVPTAEDYLSIVATRGYPMALVQNLRIQTGVGVIGSVYRDRTVLHVTDVTTVPGLERRRSRYRTTSFVALPITADRETLGVVCITDRDDDGPYTVRDVTALRRLVPSAALALAREDLRTRAERFAQAAMVDPVSGLFNRRYFEARLRQELQRAQRHNMPVALLMIDIDDFKRVNDQFGHAVGDLVLRAVSEILQGSVREFDVCARFGGEEFAILMLGASVDSASSLADRIRTRIEEYRPTEPGLGDLLVTASIGVSLSNGALQAELLEHADRALYSAKKAGKNRVDVIVQSTGSR
jgi:diguanylate cyclase (GGDEF)-like protein